MQTYAVAASNATGTGPPASANVNWVASAPAPVGLCGQFPSALHTDVGTSTFTAHTLYSESPAFAWNGVWAVRFTVPATANSSQTGQLAVAEYGSPATYREITLSPTACDFRPNDVSGNNGPLVRNGSNQVTLTFGIGGTSTATLCFDGFGDNSAIDACHLDGARALQKQIEEQFERVTGGSLNEGFGLTEASPVTHSTATLARLTPGATYYLNVRNFYAPGNYISCPSIPGRCDASARIDLPR